MTEELILLEDSQGNLILETYELPDSLITSETPLEQVLDFVRRALLMQPVAIRLAIGEHVQIKRPLDGKTVLGNNPKVVDIARTMVAEEEALKGIEDTKEEVEE